MKSNKRPAKGTGMLHYAGLLPIILLIIIYGLSCKKTTEAVRDAAASEATANGLAPFYFDNCSHPQVSGKFISGKKTTATVTLHYVNSPGGSYPAFTSAITNGIKLTAPAGNLNTGTGNITFTAVGKPVKSGYMSIPVSIAGSYTCNVPLAVLNAPHPPGNCGDPGPTPGSTGCVTFIYRGKQVTYTTVRASDGKIWLQQNLGSPQVAFDGKDTGSYGDYFQWGRWDDGHQKASSAIVTGGAKLRNPSNIPDGKRKFIAGNTTATSWWGIGGLSTDTWSGNQATTSNGKDPSDALGPGWHLPSAQEWVSVINAESIFDAASAFQSNLKLTESGYRNSANGVMVPEFVGGYYWSSTAADNNVANNLFIDAAYNAIITQAGRGYGFNLRCVKD